MKLKRNVYHIQAFNPTVEKIYNKLKEHFPNFDFKL